MVEDEVEETELPPDPDLAVLLEDLEVISHTRAYPEFANIHAYAYASLVKANADISVILAERRKAEAEAKAQAEADAKAATEEAA